MSGVRRAEVDRSALSASLLRIAGRDDRMDLAASLQKVLESCVQLFGAHGSGLMIADEHGVLRYAVATDGPGRLLEDAQLETGEGPCVDTFERSAMVSCPDVTDDPRYPRLAKIMTDSGVGGVVGVPITLAGRTVGSLDLYRTTPTEWSEGETHRFGQYGRVVETMLAAALDAHGAGQLASQLQHALDFRVPIERGVGYLMARDGLTPGDAFDKLRRAARSTRRKTDDVAVELLATGRLPDEDHGTDR